MKTTPRIGSSCIGFVVLCSITSPAVGAEHQFDIPGVFEISTRGTLFIDVPDGWDAAIAYTAAEPATEAMPAISPSPLIEITRSNDTHICLKPLDLSKQRMILDARRFMDRDHNGNRLARTAISGPHVKGTVCRRPKNHPRNYFRSHGDLTVGDLLISFTTTIDDTNVWPQVETILESFRFQTE